MKPETPPPTPEQKSGLPDASECLTIHGGHLSESRLTPPFTPSPSPQDKILLKLVFKAPAEENPIKEPVKENVVLDYVKVKRRSKRLSRGV
jgi:hypothetical protein